MKPEWLRITITIKASPTNFAPRLSFRGASQGGRQGIVTAFYLPFPGFNLFPDLAA